MVVVVRLLMVLVASEFSAKVLCCLFVVQIVEPHKSTAMVVVIISSPVKSLCVLAVVKRGKPIAK